VQKLLDFGLAKPTDYERRSGDLLIVNFLEAGAFNFGAGFPVRVAGVAQPFAPAKAGYVVDFVLVIAYCFVAFCRDLLRDPSLSTATRGVSLISTETE